MTLYYFKDCTDLVSVKMRYRDLAKEYHPDLNNGANVEIMQSINNEYEFAFEFFKQKYNQQQDVRYENKEDYTKFKSIIDKLVLMKGVEIEICGTWIWVSGNTYPYREIIRNNLGFIWSKSKKSWYYADYLNESTKKKGQYTMNKIREKYGSEKIEGLKQSELK